MKKSVSILKVLNLITILVVMTAASSFFPTGRHLCAADAQKTADAKTAVNSDIMKLSEVKAGMEGEGKTIFKGTNIETFKFKVLGVIEKFAPDKNLIIVELLDSPVLTEAGIIAGMSGSPVYIGGKIVGAVAYGFPFAKRPIGGVTPIEDIIEIDEYNRPTFSIDISDIKIQFDEKNIRRISDLLQKELVRRVTYTPHEALSPIRLIGSHKGMDPSVLSSLTPVFSMSAGMRAQTPTQKEKKKIDLKIDRKKFEIAPADAGAVLLVRGDFEFSASGTVTYVKGNKVYLFGHPFFNLGTVDLPLHKADVITVVPSFQNSFKLTATRNQVGSVLQDRFSAIQAELGRSPYMIPMKVFLESRNRTFNLEMANHPLLTPLLANVSLGNIFLTEYKQFGFQSLRVKGTIFIENEKNIIIDDLFSGPNAPNDFGGLVLAINFFLMNNKDKTIKIQKMDFEVNGSERVMNTAIENVLINKRHFYPGELIDINIHLKNERGNAPVESLQIKAPNLKAGSEFYLMVAGKNEIVRFDTKNVKSNYFPAKLSALIRAINNIRKNNRIYIKLMTPAEGIFIRGHEYSNIPSSMQNVFSFNTTTADQSKMRYSTITEYQYPVPAVVTGTKLFKLKIKARSNSDVQ
ncbi:MAG: hypothetical protein GY950_25165 [bacterium]|nr:hypothetical protein [bacterium]